MKASLSLSVSLCLSFSFSLFPNVKTEMGWKRVEAEEVVEETFRVVETPHLGSWKQKENIEC